MDNQAKQNVKSLINRSVTDNVGKGYSQEEIEQLHLYIATLLSGMKTEIKQGHAGSYIYASNGRQVVAIPSDANKLTPEVVLINIKNICSANGLDFNKYLESFQEVEKAGGALKPVYFNELLTDIVEKLSDLEYTQEIKSADQILEGSFVSNKNGVIDSREKFNQYYDYLKDSLLNSSKLGEDLKDTRWEVGQKEKIVPVIKSLFETAKEEQKRKSVEKISEVSLKDLNDKELN